VPETVTKLINYGSRKFLLAIAVLLSATCLVLTGHIADGVYSAVVIADLTAYIVGNVAQKATSVSTSKTPHLT
jgi:hypothetical protein